MPNSFDKNIEDLSSLLLFAIKTRKFSLKHLLRGSYLSASSFKFYKPLKLIYSILLESLISSYYEKASKNYLKITSETLMKSIMNHIIIVYFLNLSLEFNREILRFLMIITLY
jgi:hypothetical protein